MSYLVLYPRGSRWSSPLRKAETMLNYFLIVFGFYITGAGTYVRSLLTCPLTMSCLSV